MPGDIAVPGDYDGDGMIDLAVWRPANGSWYVRNSSDGAQTSIQYGIAGDIPVPADYDGDARTDYAVFRPTQGAWWVQPVSGGPEISQLWGTEGDIPVPADYDGDTKADIAVARPGVGATWYFIHSADGVAASAAWGTTADAPRPADYDGDGRADILMWRPGGGYWYPRSSADTTFGYDSRGNRTTATRSDTNTTKTFTYDQANRLTAAPGATYAYRGDNLRTSKTVSGVLSTFVWDESGSMPMVLSETKGPTTTRYVYGPYGAPLEAVDSTGETTFFHTDQLGSVRALSDIDGQVVGTATFDPYGRKTKTTGRSTPFGYAGEYTDAETGFQYLRNRYYDPGTGQFLTRDPIESITQEPYGYVGGNPLNYVDPLGLKPLIRLPSAGGVWDATGGKAVSYVNEHKVGILKVTSVVAGGTAIVAAPFTGGTSLAAVPAVLGGVSAGAAVSAEALDSKPCRAERVVLATGLAVLGGGVGGAFAEGGSMLGSGVISTGTTAFGLGFTPCSCNG